MPYSEPFDGEIMAARSFRTPDGRRYWRIEYFAKLEAYPRLVQCDSRAADYVARYGEKAAAENAAAYDPNFDIFEDLENSKRE